MRQRSTRTAWSMLATFAVGILLFVVVAMANGSFERDPGLAALLLAFSAFMVVGALIVARRPGHAIGWLFSAIGLLAATGPLAGEYALYAYVTRPGRWPLAAAAAWYSVTAVQLLFGLALIFTPLLFPTGDCCRLGGDPSPGWRHPVKGLAVHRGRGGISGSRLPRRPHPLAGAGAV